jgi:predicted DNA-binding transcriptional regulator AlpA
MKTLTINDLAEVLHVKPATIHDRMYRNPKMLPPRLAIPGKSKPLWLEEDVLAWLKSLRKEAA